MLWQRRKREMGAKKEGRKLNRLFRAQCLFLGDDKDFRAVLRYLFKFLMDRFSWQPMREKNHL